jgi:hypothetical protein
MERIYTPSIWHVLNGSIQVLHSPHICPGSFGTITFPWPATGREYQ